MPDEPSVFGPLNLKQSIYAAVAGMVIINMLFLAKDIPFILRIAIVLFVSISAAYMIFKK